MALSDFSHQVLEFKSGPGTAEERTDAVLSRKGWDRHIDAIPDEDCRNFIKEALRRLALRNESAKTAKEIEDDRRRKELEKAIASGMYGDLFDYVGLNPSELVGHLPCEKYWVESLGRAIPRDELASNLHAVAELRERTAALVRRLEAQLLPHKHELAIFDELLRQGSPAHLDVAQDATTRYRQ